MKNLLLEGFVVVGDFVLLDFVDAIFHVVGGVVAAAVREKAVQLVGPVEFGAQRKSLQALREGQGEEEPHPRPPTLKEQVGLV